MSSFRNGSTRNSPTGNSSADSFNFDFDATLASIGNFPKFGEFLIDQAKKNIKDSGNEYVTEAQLLSLGWQKNSTQNYINLNTALAVYNITSSKSIIMFMATCAHESGYGRSATEEGDAAYFAGKDSYNIDTRGVGYIQVTTSDNQNKFLVAMGDNYKGVKTADHIHSNYNAWEVAAWNWSNHAYGDGVIMNQYSVDRPLDIKTFLATQYFINAFPTDEEGNVLPGFSANLTGIVNAGFDYVIDIAKNELFVGGRSYPLPNGWEDRELAYNRAVNIFQ